MMVVHTERNELVFRVYMHVEVIKPVRQVSTGFPSPVFVDVAESAGEKGRLLVGRMEEFFSVKR